MNMKFLDVKRRIVIFTLYLRSRRVYLGGAMRTSNKEPGFMHVGNFCR